MIEIAELAKAVEGLSSTAMWVAIFWVMASAIAKMSFYGLCGWIVWCAAEQAKAYIARIPDAGKNDELERKNKYLKDEIELIRDKNRQLEHECKTTRENAKIEIDRIKLDYKILRTKYGEANADTNK